MSIELSNGLSGRTLGAGRLAFVVASTGFALVVLLHAIEPEYDPSWRMLSEYANGAFGWLMSLAFVSLSASCIGCIVALRREVRGIAGVLGLILLAIASVGMGLAAFFPMDPLTIDPSQATTNGALHGLAAMLGIPTFPLGALLTSFGIASTSHLAEARRWLMALGWFNVAAVVLMFTAVGFVLGTIGHFGPDAPIGWPNRLVMLGEFSWLIAAGWFARRTAR